MAQILDPDDIPWDRYPAVGNDPLARRWLETQVLLGLAPNTISAYGRAIQDFLSFCEHAGIRAPEASREEIARYVGELRGRPNSGGSNVLRLDSGAGLSNATLRI